MRSLAPATGLVRYFVLSALFVLSGLAAFAEGTKEVMPNSSNGVGLYMNTGPGAGPYLNASSENRVRFYINSTQERFYFGIKAFNRAGPTEVTSSVYFRIVNAAGTTVAGPTAFPATAGNVGYINTYAQAVAGPNVFNAAGYPARTFTPAAVGEYYIEVYESSDNGVTASAQQTICTLFDFTVGNPTLGVSYTGRVYSQAWSFITYNTSNNAGDQTVPMQSVLYGYTNDQTISKITFNSGFKPLAAVVSFNKYGAVYNATGSEWYATRRSQNTGGTAPSLKEGYKLFLNNPPVALFPRAAAPSTPVLNSVTGCPGSYTIGYTLYGAGDVAILLDLNGTTGYQDGTSDRILSDTSKVAGSYTILWDGKDGLGNSISTATAKMTVYHRIGRINLPIYDAEINTNGFSVAGLEPIAYTPRLYWNDLLLASVGGTCTTGADQNAVNSTGTGVDSSTYGMAQINYLTFGTVARAWNGSGNTGRIPAATNGLGDATTQLCDDYGNIRTLNTWWWSGELNSGQNTYNLPSCKYIAGTVYDDVNGGTINGAAVSTAASTQLYVYVVSTTTGNVVAKQSLTDGTFAFGASDGVNTSTIYRLVLSTVNVAVGAAQPASTLPSGWVNTAEGLSASSGDGTANGIYNIGATVTTYTYFDFGIDALPTPAALTTAGSQVNPGGTNTVAVAATAFSGTDAVDVSGGQINYIHVTAFPSNATSIAFAAGATTLGGAASALSYTSGTFPAGGVYVATNSTGNPSSAISVDPANGAVNVDVTYKVVDNANQESTGTGIARQPLSDLQITGTVYDDVDGVTDNIIDGTAISNAGGQLYVNLVSGGAVVASKTLSNGTFTFGTADGLRNDLTNYSVVLTASAASATAALPTTAWVNTAEGLSGTVGDGTGNGSYSFGAAVTTSKVVDFGIDNLPSAAALTTATSQQNPGGTNTVTIPATTFSGTDAGDLSGGQIAYIHITSFPTNATSISFAAGATTAGGTTGLLSYTSATFPAGGVYVATNTSGNPSTAIMVDPVNGAVNVDLTYRTADQALKESLATGTARQPLSDVTISGTVYDDVNAGIINGTAVSTASGTQLYVNLVNPNSGTVVASKTLTNGTFSFSTADGLQNNIGNYRLVLTTGATQTAADLPSTWTNTAEGISGGTGDGTANGTYAFSANVTTNTVIDFGIDALPVTTTLTTAASQQNPGGTNSVTITATTFNGTDADAANGGIISYIRIVSFPTNATSITVAGATTIGGAVTTTTYTSATFPAGGVYVATNAAGNPAANVQVDPVNGAVNVDVSYRVVDNAGKESAASGIARQPLSDLTISGSVYDDPDAGIMNGTLLSSAGGQLYVNLVNTATNTVVASKAVALGAYSFSTADGLQNNVGTYSLVLANSASATTSILPSAAYTYTAEGISGSTGDGTANGTFTFGANVVANTAVDFGVDALPTVTALNTAATQANPGGTVTVTVPATTFSGSDAGDISGGQISYIWLTSFPTNATSITVTAATTIGGATSTTSYTSATFPAGGLYIATNGAGNPATTVAVDPVNGTVNVDFSYRSIDNAGKASTATGVARQPLVDLTISGTVYDDANGGTIGGTAISNAGGPLYVNLINTATSTVVATKALSNGTYSFATADGLQSDVSTYAVILTTSAAGITPALPTTGFVNTGEGTSGTGGDANANGRYQFGANVTTSQVIDFGVDALPAPAAPTTAVSQVNPGGTSGITIPAATFSGTDAGDVSGLGQIAYIHILSFPANATTVNFAAAATTLNGTPASVSYTTANFPVGGVYVVTNAAGNPASAITADPVNGAVNVDFTYKVVDNAGQESLASGIARQPLSDLSISGNIYDDVTAGTIDGVMISNAGGQLYVNLVNTATNTVVSSKAVASGAYTFSTADGLRNDVGTYRLVLANSASATTAALPSAQWVNIAEGTSGTSGDGSVNGTFDFSAAITTSRQVDFAIEALPVPASTTAVSQVNPGGTATVTVPATAFVASDATDISGGSVSYIHITSFPANTTTVSFTSAATSVNGTYGALSYNSGNWPSGGVYLVTNRTGNPVSAVTVDPVNGAVNVDFTFTAIDNSGKESVATGLARQPLSDLSITGVVYDDANGALDNNISGTAVGSLNGTQLYANLVSGGVVIASQALPTSGSTGTFSFSTADGIVSGGSYSVVIATSATSATPSLPAGWVNTSEGTSGTGDGAANGSVTLNNLTTTQSLLYGVNATPTAISTTITALANPGGATNITVPAASFPGTDPDTNGEIAYVRLTSYPTNATSITVYAATTFGGTPGTLAYTSGTFPAGGLYIPTDGPGYLLPVDALKINPVDGATQSLFNYTVFDIAGLQSSTATTTVPYVLGAISGTVYNDFTALSDNTINGVGANLAAQGGPVYVYAIDNTNTVAGKASVGANGTYVISGLGSANYTLQLSTANVLVGAAAPARTLPGGWIFTGEGITASGDGTADGAIAITLTSNGIANADFGVDARPVANSLSAPAQTNPGGTTNITIPATSFSGTDADAANGGEIEYVHITAFPANITSMTVAGATTAGGAVSTVTYTSGTFPAGGVYVATNEDGSLLNTTAVQVDPIDGNNTITISYKVIDNAGQEGTNTATLTQALNDLVIAGTVYDDVNGGIIGGTAVSVAGGPLYVNLVSGTTVVASQQLTNGTFSFTTANGVQSNVGNYALVITNSATATTSILPTTAWTYTAEGASGSTGDGSANGTYSFGGNVVASTTVDFGLDALPSADNNTAVSQVNPGSTNTVTVPATTFSGADADAANGGVVAYVRLTAFPTNAISVTLTGSTTLGGAVSTNTYTSGSFPAGGVYIATGNNGNLSDAGAVKVDPVDGAVSVAINYVTIDNAGKESPAPATATQPLTDLLISGKVYDDANGSTDALINGTPISNAGGQLYVNLVNTATGTVVSSKMLTNGTYSFGTADGLSASVTTYQVIVANSAAALAPALNSGWMNTGEGITATAGDGFPNGRYQVGTISTARVVDFGIDARPVPAIITTAPSLTNPGATNDVSVPATTFVAGDASDLSGGQVNYVHITAFPTNATTISFAAAATTLGATTGALSYTSATFPASGVYVATNATGNPVSAISVDPADGAVNVDISFTAIDNANVESTTIGIARQPLSDLLLTGNVYDDVDGGLIDGTRISTAGGQLYVNLIDTAGNTVIASQQLSNGTFSFGTANGLRNDVTTYKLVLTTTAAGTTAALPNVGWVNTAEGITNTTGDGDSNGAYAIGGALSATTTIDFGVDARPVPVPLTVAAPKVNPGGALFIPIANNLPLALDPVDVSGGHVTLLHVISFPTKANAVTVTASETPGGTRSLTTYTAATWPAGGVYVATNTTGSTLDSFYVDPINGADTVVIQFRAIDQAGVESIAVGLGKIPFSDLTLSGNVYNDVNGDTDGLVNGTLISNAGGQLYVNLIDGTNTVIASKAVTTGAFSFGTADGLRSDVSTYRLVLAASAAATTQGLPSPAAWVNTGEGPTGAADGLANGRYTLSAAITEPTTVDFGIDARPLVTALTTATPQPNPGGNTTVTVPSATFSGSDADAGNGGTVTHIHITDFPTNANTIVFANAAISVNGTYGPATYTAATFPLNGVYVAADVSGNASASISVDPVDGAVNVDIPFNTVDNANVESTATGIARQPLSDILITGTVYDDVNGGIINGTPVANAGGQLYVNLVNTATSTVVASKALTDGTFSFGTADGLRGDVATYKVILAASASATTASLPDNGWVNLAEGSSGSTGDGAIDGSFTFGGLLSGTQVVDFAIDALPTANNNTAISQVNPGGTTLVTVPATTFSGSDATDLAGGQVSYVRLTAFPSNATSVTIAGSTTIGGAVSTNSYTSGNFPAGGIYIATAANGNLSDANAVKADPTDGAVTIVFPYAVIDNAGKESLVTANASQPLSGLFITGTLYRDFNGLTDGLLNGTGTNDGNSWYINAINNGVVAGSALLASDGSYTISGLSAGTYNLVLTTSAAGTTPSLPVGYVNTAEGNGSTSDGSVDGATVVELTNVNVTGVNFGFEEPAWADTKNFALNPFTSPYITSDTRSSTLNAGSDYAFRISMSGMASSGAVPGAPTALDPDGNSGSALTLTAGTPNVSLLINPATYSGYIAGVSSADNIVILYDGVQLQAGGCQGSDIGSSVCSYYNSVSGNWEIPVFDLSKLSVLAKNGVSSLSFQYFFRDAAGFEGLPATYQMVFSTPLPVHLITFTGVKRGSTAVLNWTVDNESNFRGYGVERSLDGRNFEQLGFVTARNLANVQQYGYNDDLSALSAWRVYYRLKQLNLDGTYTYSGVVTITLSGMTENTVTVLTNPVKGAVRMQVRSAAAGNAVVALVDAAGRVLLTRRQQVPQGSTTFNVEVSGFAANGIYTVVTVLNGERFATRIFFDR